MHISLLSHSCHDRRCSRKKVTARLDKGRLSSDSGVILLSLAEHQGAKTLAAALITDPRDAAHITHTFTSRISAANIHGEFHNAARKPAPLIEAACWTHARRKSFELATIRKGANRH
jgi:hypothetical protein